MFESARTASEQFFKRT